MLLTLDNEIDTTTGTVKAKAVFDNKNGALFPNQFVNVRLILEQRANSVVLPASALQNGVKGSFVFLLKSGIPPPAGNLSVSSGSGSGGSPKASYYVDVREIIVDVTQGNQIIVKSGLQAGDQVIVDGQEKLKKYSMVDPNQVPVAASANPGASQ
jgi:multidrug efflux system membrane fusion protein